MNKNQQLSTHFKLSELIITETGMDNTPTESFLPRLKWTAGKLEEIRALYNKPIYVTSCYRSLKVNRAVGGSATSLHLTGTAVDFRISNYTVQQLPGLFKAILDTHPYELYPIDRNTLHVSWYPLQNCFDLGFDPFSDIDIESIENDFENH